MIDWDSNSNALKKNDVILHEANVTAADLNDSELPTDIHIVEYSNGGKYYSDAVRAPKMSNVFDVYYDILSTTGGRVVRITNGYGKIKPKLYQTQKKDDK